MDEMLSEVEELREAIGLALRDSGGSHADATEIRAQEFVTQLSLETGRLRRVMYVELMAQDLETATLLNGRRNLYNGPDQKLLEQQLQISLRSRLPLDRVRLQITCPTPLEDIDFGPQEQKEIQRVTLADAITTGVIAQESSVAPYCGEYALPFLLVRNGHVVGPSPALAEALKMIAPSLRPRSRVFDPFAGTGLAKSVLTRIRPDAEVLAGDRLDMAGRMTGFDALTHIPDEEFDLVIVDPLYEDVLRYSREILPRIRTRLAIVVTGDTSDVDWNKAASRLLNSIGQLMPGLESLGRRWGQNLLLVAFEE